jgi:hypothetical protein
MKKKPSVGLRVNCNSTHLVYLNSDVPAVRIRFVDETWLVNDKDAKLGMLVFINQGSAETLQAVTITEVRNSVAFATAS